MIPREEDARIQRTVLIVNATRRMGYVMSPWAKTARTDHSIVIALTASAAFLQ